MNNFYTPALPRASRATSAVSAGAALLVLLCAAACSDDGAAGVPDAALPDAGAPDAVPLASGHIVFVNPNPTAFSPGTNGDSVANIHSYTGDAVMTTGVPASLAAIWPEVLTCFREMLAPYDVTVVEEDPGDLDHIEIAVSDKPMDVGSPAGIGGITTGTCIPLPRGVSFAFASVFGESVQDSCENLGWLLGHTVGLETAYHCPDVTTFLQGCGAKSFTDVDAECGEFEVRECVCGGATQNSHQRMLEVYGARPQ